MQRLLLRQSEIKNLGLFARRNKNVSRFNVAMNDAS